jgi:general secretion pathway protein N
LIGRRSPWPRRGAAAVPAGRGVAAGRAWRLAVWGAAAGSLAALVVFAPAAWVAAAVNQATDGHVLLTEPTGSVWRGQARLTLSGGAGSRDALTLPGRVGWRLGVGAGGAELALDQACCLAAPLRLRLEPGLGRWALQLEPAATGLGQWPAAWLAALGTPWNTLQLTGTVRLSSAGLRLESAQGRWRLEGELQADFDHMASRLSTLPRLGSYRLSVRGGGPGSDAATVGLATTAGPLLLSGEGQWTGARLRLRGEARAEDGSEAALPNLLNLLGRREGARAVLAIG